MRNQSILRRIQQKLLWAPVYRIGCLRGINPTLVLFAGGPEGPDANLLPLMERLAGEGYDCRYFSGGRALKFIWTYARARAAFLADALPNDCRPRPGTAVVQLRHGCGSFRRADYSAQGRAYTHICACAPDLLPQLAEAYACDPAVIVPWGMPRTDIYCNAAKVEEYRQMVLEAFPGIGGRKIVLYAPAFRGEPDAARRDGVLDYDALSRELDAGCALLIRSAPPARTPLPPPDWDFVFDAAGLPAETLLCAADLLISDYSPLVFEYALLGRPMLFYPYDLETRGHSFHFPYLRFVPGDLAWDTEDIIAGVRRGLFEGQFDPARVQAFRGQFMSACDGHATERILHNVLNI